MTAKNHTQIAFVCVENAGRSQMAYAFAERAIDERDLADAIRPVMGGTQPADRIHPEVVEAMAEVGIEIGDRSPRSVTVDELVASEFVITMGCSADEVCPAGWGGENRDWDLADPAGKSIDRVRTLRNEIERRVHTLLDEVTDS